MHEEAQTVYLESAVKTATPQKLRLMLIEGAIRFATAAKEKWCDPIPYEVLENTRRCQSILAELYAGVRPETGETARKTAELYLFLYREVIDVLADEDAGKLDDVIGILEIERETWQQVCELLPDAPQAEAGTQGQASEIVADQGQHVDAPTYGAPLSPSSSGDEGLSLEA